MTMPTLVWLILDLTTSDGASRAKFPHSDMVICLKDIENVEFALRDAEKYGLLKAYILKIECVRE